MSNLLIVVGLSIFALGVLAVMYVVLADEDPSRTEAGKKWLERNPYDGGQKRAVELEAANYTKPTEYDQRPAFMREHESTQHEIIETHIRRLKADGTPDRRYKGGK